MSSIDLSDYKKALRKLKRYGGGIIPQLTFNRIGNRTVNFIFIGKKHDNIVNLCKLFMIQVPQIHGDKLRSGYYYAVVEGGDSVKVLDHFLGKRIFIRQKWAKKLGVEIGE